MLYCTVKQDGHPLYRPILPTFPLFMLPFRILKKDNVKCTVDSLHQLAGQAFKHTDEFMCQSWGKDASAFACHPGVRGGVLEEGHIFLSDPHQSVDIEGRGCTCTMRSRGSQECSSEHARHRRCITL